MHLPKIRLQSQQRHLQLFHVHALQVLVLVQVQVGAQDLQQQLLFHDHVLKVQGREWGGGEGRGLRQLCGLVSLVQAQEQRQEGKVEGPLSLELHAWKVQQRRELVRGRRGEFFSLVAFQIKKCRW
jgi:hypothetical protein